MGKIGGNAALFGMKRLKKESVQSRSSGFHYRQTGRGEKARGDPPDPGAGHGNLLDLLAHEPERSMARGGIPKEMAEGCNKGWGRGVS